MDGTLPHAVHNRRTMLFAGPAFLAVLLGGTRARADKGGRARRSVQLLISDLQERSASAGQSRADQLLAARAVVDRWFDLDAMAAAALGNSWRALAYARRRRYVEAFTGFLTKGLADRSRHLAGAQWTVLGSRDVRSGLVSVHTRYRKVGGQEHDVEWLVDVARRSPVVDVTADGIVMSLRLRRDFARIVAESGVDRLIEDLETGRLQEPGRVLP